MTDLPLCIQCKHAQQAEWAHPRRLYECKRYPSLVDGETLNSCDYVRGPGFCRMHAIGFEPKEETAAEGGPC
jgi:hypothetical protein